MSHVQVTPTGWMQGPMGDIRVDIHYLNDAMEEDAVATTGGKGATSAAVGPATSSAAAAEPSTPPPGPPESPSCAEALSE